MAKAASDGPTGLSRIAPLRFIAFVAISALGSIVAAPLAGWQHAVLIGFDIGAVVFLISLIPLFRKCETDDMRRHAAANDANRILLLVVTAAVSVVILVAIALELGGKGNPEPLVIGLVVATLALSWLFSNTVYALHYAHIYYIKDDDGDGDHKGVAIPHADEPDYWDFVYFSYTLGMTFQTSDTEICSRHIRRVVTFHCLLAFIFNIGVIAFTINILGG